jgi:pSer/pThr/pTyr-binding forkhead associated (FHA) protein
VSGVHCKVVKSGNIMEVVDCSTNGTFKNGKKIDGKSVLKNGDIIHLLISGEGITDT